MCEEGLCGGELVGGCVEVDGVVGLECEWGMLKVVLKFEEY